MLAAVGGLSCYATETVQMRDFRALGGSLTDKRVLNGFFLAVTPLGLGKIESSFRIFSSAQMGMTF